MNIMVVILKKHEEGISNHHVKSFFFLVEIGTKLPIKLNTAELIQSYHNTNFNYYSARFSYILAISIDDSRQPNIVQQINIILKPS